jgi:DNA polymerase-3 subunit alpha
MELACKYPIIYWNTANLIVNSGATDGEEEDEENDPQDNESESSTEPVFCSEELQEEEDELLDTEEDNPQENGAVVKKKKPNKIDYGKIATAIGSMQSAGITIALPDINKSSFTFTPVESENKIYYGIKGILKIGKDLAKDIIKNRPYVSINDFLCKVKVNKPQMVNLIKSGAFDGFGERTEIMKDYILSICGAKTTLNMRNAQKLIEKKLFPEELSFNVKVFNFNKFIKKISKDKGLTDKYYLDPYCFSFYERNFDTENVSIEYENDEPVGYISSAMWDKMYKKLMQPLSDYIKSHLNDLLIGLNKELFDDFWNKYALGNISKWEMDSVNFYFHDHELKKVPKIIYELEDFKSMPETAEVVNTIPIKGRDVQIYRITRIAGTVIDKNNDKNTVTILTTTGVVDVKIYANQFSIFDKQISAMGADGHKKVIEKSWFSRGNKIIFTGIRRENNFIPKKYKSTPYHLVELITNIDDKGLLTTVTERAEA